ncbi:Zinc finger putative Transcription Factor family [Ditylenchus destructor]|uniref:Zinc finger putative Transcription Factor family n=1 Tax=Ditylenchus destructor TaxID=166010 RepID=A0AAD4RDK4_9BILA|nr:Zinc finger putative Transcription Factor family [Ditylenchus destructor]
MPKCTICHNSFPNADELEAHISDVHFDCVPYECEKCRYSKFPTEFAIRRHYTEDHGMQEYFVRFKVTPAIQEKRTKIKECLATSLQESSGSDAISPPRNDNAEFSQTTVSAMNMISTLFNCVPESIRHANEVVEDPDPPSVTNTEEHDMDVDERERSHRCDIKPIITPVITLDSEDSHGSEEAQTTANTARNPQKSTESSFSGFHLENEHNPSTSVFDTLNSNRGLNLADETISAFHDDIPNQLTVNKAYTIEDALNQKFRLGTVSVKLSPQNEPRSEFTPLSPEKQNDCYSQLMTCKVCKTEVMQSKGTKSLDEHINMDHLRLPVYRCKQCTKQFYCLDRNEVMQHIKNDHKKREGAETMLEDNSGKYLSEIIARRHDFFLNEASNTSAQFPPLPKNKRKQLSKKTKQRASQFFASKKPDLRSMRNTRSLDGNDLQLESTSFPEAPSSSSAQPRDKTPQLQLGIPSVQIGSMRRERTKGESRACKECGEVTTMIDDFLLNHANRHALYPLYLCRGCDKTFTTYPRQYMVRHIKTYHNADMSLLVDDRQNYEAELRRISSQIFARNNATEEPNN